MSIRIPNLEDRELTKFLTEWTREFDRLKRDAMSNVAGNRALLLISPGLKVYEVKVDDAGVLSTTYVAG